MENTIEKLNELLSEYNNPTSEEAFNDISIVTKEIDKWIQQNADEIIEEQPNIMISFRVDKTEYCICWGQCDRHTGWNLTAELHEEQLIVED